MKKLLAALAISIVAMIWFACCLVRADEPLLVTIGPAEEYSFLTVSDWALKDGKKVKISCPDGYNLEGRLFSRINVPCPIATFCLESHYTDAELKCVKDS